MSENRLLFTSSLSLAFVVGILSTLLLTGSIRTHFGHDEGPPTPAPAITYQSLPPPTPQTEVLAPDERPVQTADNTLVELLKGNIEGLKVASDTATQEEARKQLYEEFSRVKSIAQGAGSKHIYILFDPLCKHCHNLYRDLASGKTAEYDLTAHWIPAVAFLENPLSQMFSQRLVTALQAGQTELAQQALMQHIHNGDSSLLATEDWKITEEAIMRVARNTVGLIQAGTGTPAVIYKNVNGDIEIIDGTPTAEDFGRVL